MKNMRKISKLSLLALGSLLIFEGNPIPEKEINLPLNCETLLNGQPYRYIRDPFRGLKYETCKMEDGKPVLYTDYKDRGFTTITRF